MAKALTKRTRKKKSKLFPIVAIGASAGGVEAITELVKNLPVNSGMAFVYIQHLDPTHKSQMPDILSRVTKMQIQTARERMRVDPDNIYLIPHDQNLTIVDGMLKLTPRQKGRPVINMPIDKFFRSLADVHKERAIGVILSGNANDGTAGLKEIKNNGGITFAQDSSAKFESMPKSAIAEGCVDMILAPKDIAVELGKISQNVNILSKVLLNGDDLETIELPGEDLQEIIGLLRRSVGVDFTHYKPSTIKRRIIRRMLLYKLPSLKDYLDYLKQHTNEIHVLFQDLLINVTAFFRDADTLEFLKKTVLPKIAKSKLSSEAIRVWVPACSTGEEAYSVAIILSEIIAEKGLTIPLQVFASDLSETAISKARIGLYSKSDVADVSPKRLQSFFTRIDGSYRINKIIRDACVFAPHNVISDPPFSRLDLITCCNLLIYLDPILQKKIIATFHYSLRPDGYLVLGKSETLGTATHLFSQVDKKFKVYARNNEVSNKLKFEMNYRAPEVDRKTPAGKTLPVHTMVRDVGFEKRVEDILLSKYVAASVVVNKELDILQFHGPINSFLEISPGKATLNLLKLVRPGLVFDLRNTIHKATKSNKPETKSGLEVTVNGLVTNISAEVIPLGRSDEEKMFLIIFQKLSPAGTDELKKSSHTKDQLVKRMQAEMETTKEDIRSILEEQEASNEELQSANEEIVSSNEELQSINEELETSKEEVESSNEELMTINNELQVRNEQLAESHEYSEAIAETIREAVLILDRDFRVRSANKAFYRIFKTKEAETEGMLIYELGNRQWDILELRQLLEELIWKRTVITGYEVQHDFPSIGNKVMLIHGRAIVQKLLQKELIIIAIEDITEHRLAQRMAEERELRFRNMADNAPCMIWTTGPDKVRSFFNKTWYEFTGVENASNDKEFWFDSIHPDDRRNYLDHFNKNITSKSLISAEYRMKRSDGEYRWVLDVAKPYYSDDQKFLGYIGTSTELHDKRLHMDELDRQVKERTKELKTINSELKRSNSELEQFAYVASHDLQEPLRKILTYIDRIQYHDGLLPTASKGYFEKIVESARRMTKLIDDLLDFSTISFSKKTFVKVDLNRVIKDVLADLDLLIIEKKGKVTFDGKLPVIEGEPMQMTQLFYNLIGNALKFARESIAPRVKISYVTLSDDAVSQFKELDGPGPYIQLIIADNGIGFNPEFAEQIFVIFQRLNERKKFPGTGIGLALCKRIVTNHHGHIFARSNSNGSDFYVILPLTQDGNGNN
jgi:two-component system CheB/CheR fusion protein